MTNSKHVNMHSFPVLSYKTSYRHHEGGHKTFVGPRNHGSMELQTLFVSNDFNNGKNASLYIGVLQQ